MNSKLCLYCGVSFKREGYYINQITQWNKKKFCSYKCSCDFRFGKYRDIIKTCITCKKEFRQKELSFYISPSNFFNRKYCSQKCLIQLNKKKIQSSKYCLFCNKKFIRNKYDGSIKKWNQRKFCCNECKFLSMVKSNTKIKMKMRSSEKMKRWRKEIFERDNWSCVLCNKKGKINADHYPISFSCIFDIYNLDTLQRARKCGMLWDINNGRTLCLSCHQKTDNYFNKGRISKML